MVDTLTCPICSKPGLKRLTRHLRQAHQLSKEDFLVLHPDHPLEVTSKRDVKCVSCGNIIEGYSGRAANVKCDSCRVTPSKRKVSFEDTNDLVACRICGVQRRRLGRHLKTAHRLTPDEYLQRFPDALVEIPGTRKRSAACRAKQSAAARRRWVDPTEREAQSARLQDAAPWKGKKLSEEHKQAIGDGGRGVTHDITDEDRKNRAKRGRRVLKEVRSRPGYGDRLSEAHRRRAEHDEGMGFRNPETWKKGYETRLKNGTLNPPGSGRGICGFRKGLSHYTRSTLEANFARVLIEAGVPYEYEPKVVRISPTKTYTPDFRLTKPLGDLVPAGWVELKGWRHKDGRLPEGTAEKVAGFEEATGERVFVLTSHDPVWKKIERLYRDKIELWESPRQNLRTDPTRFGV